MYKAAVIGDYDSIYGFASAGMKIVPVSEEKECIRAFKHILNSDYGVVFVTENYADAIDELIEEPIPAVMYIPSQKGHKGCAMLRLHELVEKAAGADLL